MDGCLKSYIGFLFLFFLVYVAVVGQRDDTVEYNPERDLEHQSESPAEPNAVNGNSDLKQEKTQDTKPEQSQTDTEQGNADTGSVKSDELDEGTKRAGDIVDIPIVHEPVQVNMEIMDPYAELDMLMQTKMASIKNASQFCELLDIGCEVLEKDDAEDGDGEKVLVSGEGASQVALFDACNPREQTVALPKDPDPDITIWPTCTRALRCGGCCTSDVFSCEPTETRERFVRVFRTRQPYKGAQHFRFIDAKSVKIIEHVRCDAQCKVKAIHCNPLQQYQSRYCRCVCTNQNSRATCTEDQIWDDNECACVCPQRKTTFCPHPSRFSDHLCKCTLMQEVAGEIDLAQLLANLGREIVVEQSNKITTAPTTTTTESTTTTTTTTPTTTTTTVAPTTVDRCADEKCMPNWQARWDDRRKKCRCFPKMMFGGK